MQLLMDGSRRGGTARISLDDMAETSRDWQASSSL
jgi:hypothetical protein